MATYDKSKFYWLQLKEDFFDEDAIDWLEEQPNGKEYSLFYLKLCLKSLRTNGILIRRVGNVLIPYDHVKLGEMTKTNPDTVFVAMNLLMRVGLVQTLENGELYLTQVENMIGAQSKSAFKKQQQRLTKREKLAQIEGVDKCPPDIEIDIEQELDIELETDTPIGEVSDKPKTMKEDNIDTAFATFWEAYPKKINRNGSYKAFCNIKRVVAKMPAIMGALERFKQSQEWAKENGKYIPYPLTWLRQERWLDVQDTIGQARASSFDGDEFFASAVNKAMGNVAHDAK